MVETAIVTGGGGGLGREIAVGLGRAGYGVVVADVDERAARECAGLVEAAGSPAWAVCADVRVAADRERVVAAALAGGGLRVLVNNAGGWTPGEQYPRAVAEAWVSTIELNLVAAMALGQRVLEPMRAAGGGAVVNVASSGGIGFESYGSPEYGAAKAGLIRFTAALADSDGVRMMCVAPDWIGLPRARVQWERMSAAQRAACRPLIDPAEVVAVVLDLVRRGVGGTVVELWGGDPPVVRVPGR